MRNVELILLLLFVFAGAKAQRLDTIQVSYFDPDGNSKVGVIVCNHVIADKLERIFGALYEAHYPIASIRPMSEFGNDDEKSMEANNTSCYCNRSIAGSKKKSKHALGLAIDLNPLWNPCVKYNADGSIRKIEPRTAKSDRHIINHNDLAYKLFKKEGFRWGGDWTRHRKKDYQHFEAG